MRLPILMIFQFVTIIGAWAAKALEDGKITANEGLELVERLAMIIGVPLELAVPDVAVEISKPISGASGMSNADNFLAASKQVSPED